MNDADKTTDDVREALAQLNAALTHPGSGARRERALHDAANTARGVLLQVSQRGTVADDYEAGYGEGFHHGRSTPTEHHITDAEVEAAVNTWHRTQGTGREDWYLNPINRERMRAALEAAREAAS